MTTKKTKSPNAWQPDGMKRTTIIKRVQVIQYVTPAANSSYPGLTSKRPVGKVVAAEWKSLNTMNKKVDNYFFAISLLSTKRFQKNPLVQLTQ